MSRRSLVWGHRAVALTLSVLAAAFSARPPVPARARATPGVRPVSRPVRGRGERVSVVVPAYRAATTIARAVQSVLDQTVPVHELLVIDDGSPDDLAAALAPFGDRVTRIVKPNGGVSSARNLGIARSTGELIAFLDADDYWEPDKLARQLDVLEAHPDVAIVASQLFLQDAGATDRRLDPNSDRALYNRRLELDGPEAFHAAGMFWTGTVMVRRDVLGDTRFDEALTTAEDRELWLQMLLRAPAWLGSAPTATCVLEPGSLSRGNVDRDCTNMLALLDRYHDLLGDDAYDQWRSEIHRRWSMRLLSDGRSREALIPALVNLRHAPSVKALWTVVRSAAQATTEPRTIVAPSATLAVDVIGHVAGLAALRDEWTTLHARATTGSFATTWEWMATWWDVFGADRSLRVVTVRDGGRLIGVLPLAERLVPDHGVPIRRLEFLGTGEPEADEILSEYLDALIEPGREREVMAAMWRRLAADDTWDELRLKSIEHGSRTRATLRDAAAGSGIIVRERERSDAVIVQLAADPARFAAAQSKKMREDLRRHRRLLEKSGEVRLTRAATLEQLRAMFPTFVQLHQSLWRSRGKPGCFASDRFRAFHEQVSTRLWSRGVVHLHVLTAGDRAVAARYGFQLGARMFEYQSGVDPELDGRVSIGMIAANLCMEEAITRGATVYDLGEGARPYKLRWQHELRPTYDLRIVRRNARTELVELLDSGEQRLREVRRVVAEAKQPA